MLEHKYSQDDLIDMYLGKQLSAEELADFEIRMLEDPQLMEAVQQAELMRETFKEQQAPAKSHSNVSYLPFRAWIKQPLSLAASVVLGVGVLLSGSEYLLLDDGGLSIENGYAVSSVINLSPTRSAQEELVLSGGVHLLQVDVGISLADVSYLLSFTSEDNSQNYEFSVTPDSNGIVRLLTPATLAGSYIMEVRNSNNAESLRSYRISFN